MSSQFPHSARLTPPFCTNAWGKKSSNVTACWELLWLPVVFCWECAPDVFAVLCQLRGVVWFVCVSVIFVLLLLWRWCAKRRWYACTSRGLKMNPPTPHSTRHPSISPSEGVWGSREGREGGSWCENGVTLSLSEIWAIYARLPLMTATPCDRPCRLCDASAVRCWDDQYICCHHHACGLDEEHLSACVLQLWPACHAWMAPCWSLKTPQRVSDQLQAVSPSHRRVINLIHHFARCFNQEHHICFFWHESLSCQLHHLAL